MLPTHVFTEVLLPFLELWDCISNLRKASRWYHQQFKLMYLHHRLAFRRQVGEGKWEDANRSLHQARHLFGVKYVERHWLNRELPTMLRATTTANAKQIGLLCASVEYRHLMNHDDWRNLVTALHAEDVLEMSYVYAVQFCTSTDQRIRILKRCSHAGHVAATLFLIQYGDDEHWTRVAADQGDGLSCQKVADMLAQKGDRECLVYWAKADAAGVYSATLSLCSFYLFGSKSLPSETKRDTDKGLFYFRRASMYVCDYFAGFGFKSICSRVRSVYGPAEYLKYLEIAAEHNNPCLLEDLVELHRSGADGIAPNRARAIQICQRRPGLGLHYQLGRLYDEDPDVPRWECIRQYGLARGDGRSRFRLLEFLVTDQKACVDTFSKPPLSIEMLYDVCVHADHITDTDSLRMKAADFLRERGRLEQAMLVYRYAEDPRAVVEERHIMDTLRVAKRTAEHRLGGEELAAKRAKTSDK